jgi:uncharacterized protein
MSTSQRSGTAWFLLIAFGTSWALWGSLWLAGIPLKSAAGPILVALGMWGPGLSALVVTRFVLRESWRTTTLNRLGRKRYYAWAWLLPAAGTLIAALLTVAFGVAAFDPEFQKLKELTPTTGSLPPISFGTIVLIQVLVGILLAPLLNAPFAVGEEIGWRGFLLPRLLQSGVPQWPALVITGLIWGLWHAPVIVQGHNYPDHPLLGVALMTGVTILLGIILGWLQLASGSVWVPTVAHGALNGIAGLPILILTPHDSAIGGMLTSAIGWIPLAGFVAWLALSRRVPVKSGPAALPPSADSAARASIV